MEFRRTAASRAVPSATRGRAPADPPRSSHAESERCPGESVGPRPFRSSRSPRRPDRSLEVDVVLDAEDDHLGRVLDQKVSDSREGGGRLDRAQLAEAVTEVDVLRAASAIAHPRAQALGGLHEAIIEAST